MSFSNEDLEALLAGILDDAPPVKPEAARAINAAQGQVGTAVMESPESFLDNLMNSPDPSPMDVASAAEMGSEMVLAEVTQSVTPYATLASRVETEAAGIFTDSTARDINTQVQALKMPVFTAADFASVMDIRNFATLVTLNTARWHAKVKDRQASKDAASMNEADENSFETRKLLLVGADGMLKTIHKVIDDARKAHYDMTLPWSTTSMTDQGRRTGGRLLPNTLFVEYTMVMAKKKQAMKDALALFIPEYPQLIEQAKKKLGKRFDVREYPNVSSISSHFDLSFDFQPIPKGDDFKGLPQVQLDALATKINDNTRKQAEYAMQEVWARLHEAVGKMAERLSSPDKMFHTTLVQNIRDVARLLSHLNVTQDAKVEALRLKVEQQLCVHDTKTLKTNLTVRAQVGAAAQDILKEMDQ